MSKQTIHSAGDSFYTWLTLLLSLGLLFWSTAIALEGEVLGAAELYIFNWLYDIPEPIARLMLFVTNVGTAVLLLLVAVWLDIKRRYQLLVRVVASVGVVSVLVLLGKNMIGRVRPDILLDIAGRELFLIGGEGFPSGHTAVVTAIVFTLLQFVHKKYWTFLLTLVGLVAASRISLGAHLPLDVVGGFALGVLVAVSMRLATTSEVFYKSRKHIASRIKKA